MNNRNRSERVLFKGINHEKLNIFIFINIALFLLGLYWYGYLKKIPYETIINIFIGLNTISLFLTPDLDAPSRSWFRWGLLKFIWLPFHSAGHRGILHNWFWGPFILGSINYFFLQLAGSQNLSTILIGFIISIESHILSDWVNDRRNTWLNRR